MEIWADSRCAPLVAGYYDAATEPDLEPLRREALKRGLPADRLAAEALLDPVACRRILAKLRKDWLLDRDLPECQGFLHKWVAWPNWP